MKVYFMCAFCLLLIINVAKSQNSLIAISKKTQVAHSLKIPNYMQVTEKGLQNQRFEVLDANIEGLITSNRIIPFANIQSIQAARYKKTGKKVLGVLVTLSGLALTTGGFVLLADDWIGPSLLYFFTGITVTTGGIKLLSATKKYNSSDWQFRTIPAERGMVPVTPAER